jgi:tetratricopeptide (TPR) repeat protein
MRMIPELGAEPQPDAGDAEQLRFRLFDAVTRLLRESGSAKPIMLVLDDLHDADVASLQLLKFVARMVHDARLIIVGTYRDAVMRHSPERAAIVPDILRDATHFRLAGLAEDEVARMVEVRAQRAPDPELVAALSRTTAGNPLFVDGIIRVLAAEGRFGSAQLIALESYNLPDEVRAAIQRWLGLLSPEAHTLLTTAALIGLEFERGILGKATATASERVAELIRNAQDVGIASSVGKSLCRFTHPLLREVLSQEPTPEERVRLHRSIAISLEEIHRDDFLPYLSVLAHHWRESAQSPEEVDKAINYSILAGDAAAKALAIHEAVSRWHDALQLNKEHQRDQLQRADILARLGGDHAVGGREKQGLKNLEDALAIYERLGMTTKAAEVHMRLCWLLHSPLEIIDLPRAEQHFREAEALFRQMQPDESMARLYSAWGFVCLWRMRVPEAFEAANRAVEIAKEHGSPSVRAETANVMAASLFAAGRLRESLTQYSRIWHQADQLNDPLAGGITQQFIFILTILGDFGEALKWSRREMARPRNRQGVYYQHFALGDQINLHSLMGELDEVRRLMATDVDSRRNSAGELHLIYWEGDLEKANASWGGVADFWRSRQQYESLCIFASLLAYIRHWAGHHDTAIELLKETLSYSVSGGYVPLEMQGRQCLSHICAQTGRIEEARANIVRCREIMASEEDWRGQVGGVKISEAAIAVAEQRFDDADRHFAEALQIIRRYAARSMEGPALCDWGRALSAAGQRHRALEKFDEAIEFYRRVGAGQPWIDRAEADRAQVGSSKSHTARLGQTSVEALFRKEQDFWTIRYGHKLFRLKNSRGLGYIAQLLRYPEREIHALVLTGGAEMNGPGGAGEILDSTARSDYRHRIEELREELEEAERFNDEGRAAKARAELDELESYLAGAVGLGGRSRRASTDAERARVAVTKGIKAAIQQIRAIDPELGRHLSTAVSTGYFCCYHLDHDHPVSWQL